MERKRLLVQGGMNVDDDASVFPEGDYKSARNIVSTEGINGERGAFRKMEGFTSDTVTDPLGIIDSAT